MTPRAAAWRLARWLALGLALPGGPVQAGDALSQAEELLFVRAHLSNTASPGVLRYRYASAGSLAPAVEDEVSVRLEPGERDTARKVHVDYLSGQRALALPDIDSAAANPVILFFLERDVREMQRLTGGQASYFRKRVRLALADAAQVRAVTIEHEGKAMPAWEISVRPFDDDPMKSRFAAYADKRYAFTLCEGVPGMVVELRATMADRRAAPADGSARPALMDEAVRFVAAQP
jgi:hypothetical protein